MCTSLYISSFHFYFVSHINGHSVPPSQLALTLLQNLVRCRCRNIQETPLMLRIIVVIYGFGHIILQLHLRSRQFLSLAYPVPLWVETLRRLVVF